MNDIEKPPSHKKVRISPPATELEQCYPACKCKKGSAHKKSARKEKHEGTNKAEELKDKKIKVFIRTLGGGHIPFEVCLSDTIEHVTETIKETTNAEPCEQLMLKNRLLNNLCTIADYNIQQHDVLRCVSVEQVYRR